MQKYNALIIGAGNIGAFFDNPKSPDVFTHAHAFYKHANFNLVGFVDNDTDKAQKAAELWSCKSFKSIEEAFDNAKIEVVSVAVPDEFHYQTLKSLAEYDLKLVFAEKPFAKTLSEAEDLIKMYKNKKLPVLINYSRRFVPEIYSIKENIQNGIYGEYITGTGYYGKGILHNGSHMIDLLRLLIGETVSFNCINTINDFYEDDPSVSVLFKFERNKNFTLNAVDCRNFTIFEADFIFEKKRIKLINSGFLIEEYKIEHNKNFIGYKNLCLSKTIDTSLNHSMYNAINNIYEFLAESKPLMVSINDGYRAMETSVKILESL